jgi:hypothetical protein
LAAAWLDVCGLAPITYEIRRFLRDEARRLPIEAASGQKESLEALLSWTLVHGLPAQHMEDVQDYRTIEAIQRHGEGNLLAVLNALVHRLNEDSKTEPVLLTPNWPGPEAFRRMVERLLITGDAGSALGDCLSYMTIALPARKEPSTGSMLLVGLWLPLVDLRGSNLMSADLRGANLTRANLMSADLRGAKCSRLNIDSARLHFADCTESVDLKQEQINRALGNRDTKLPPGLDHPDNWDDE